MGLHQNLDHNCRFHILAVSQPVSQCIKKLSLHTTCLQFFSVGLPHPEPCTMFPARNYHAPQPIPGTFNKAPNRMLDTK
uniref:Repressor of RNA polymerase III transcription n=1 Tax=Rhizophora mucronata TaxID=61149 RepID=A0A2P2MM86_RHIMU